MRDKTRISLIASEIYGLWQTYMNDTLVKCTMEYFLNNLDDEEIRPLLQQAFDISDAHIKFIVEKFGQEGLPIPQGFTADDVSPKEPRLFTDPFYLFYLSNLAMYEMGNYSLILNLIARPDLRRFFADNINESIVIYNKSADLLQSEGLFIRAPRVEVNKQVDYVDNQHFFSGGLLGKKRPLLTNELTTIFAGLRQHLIGSALTTGFAQVAKSKEVREYLLRCREVSSSRIKKVTSILLEEKISIPSTSESFVTDSTIPPFSEKLMMNHIQMLFGMSVSQDASSLSIVMRNDLKTYYAATIAGNSKVAEDGADILIRNRWMEQPPQAISHEALATVK